MDMIARLPTVADIRKERIGRRIEQVLRAADAQPEAKQDDLTAVNKIRDEARARYQLAVDEFVANAKVNALAKKKKSQEEMVALFLLLILDAEEETYKTVYEKLEEITPSAEGRGILETELQEEAAAFAASRQEDLAGFAERISRRFVELVIEARKSGADEKKIRSLLNKAAKAAKEGYGIILADTESQMTSGSVQFKLIELAGYKNAYWVGVGDELERDGHIENEAAGLVEIGQQFPDGCRFPGDPEAPIECTINCRCWMIGGERK